MSDMRAMVIIERGGRFQLQSRELPRPGSQEVRLRVHACGVCHSDALTVQGAPIPGLDYPRIPGHEVIGTIDALGDQVRGWRVGERVGVGWFSGACGYRRECRRGNAFACENVHGATGVTMTAAMRPTCSPWPPAWRTCPRGLMPSSRLHCCARESRRSTRCATAGRGRAMWLQSRASGASDTSASSLPRDSAFARWPSTADAIKSSSHARLALPNTSTVPAPIPPRRCRRSGAPARSSPP